MGTEEFWIPAVMAAVSAAGSAVNSNNANQRSQNAEVQAQDNQNMFRNQANNLVKQQTQKIATSDPDAIANQEKGNFVNTLRQNVGGNTGNTSTDPTNFGAPTSALGPTAGASSRYKSGSTAAAEQTQQYGNTYAGDESAVDAAVRQRQNEGLQMQTLATNLNGINQQSYSQGFVDQLRAKAAGVQSPWASLFSGVLGGAAQSAAKNGWFTPGPSSTAGTAALQQLPGDNG
jgi:hypothetical protein